MSTHEILDPREFNHGVEITGPVRNRFWWLWRFLAGIGWIKWSPACIRGLAFWSKDGDVLVYKEVLTDKQRRQVERYLADRFQ